MTTISEKTMPANITPGDSLKEKESRIAGEAVDLLQKAAGRMSFIRDHGGKRVDVMGETEKAYEEAVAARSKISEVHILRRDQ